MIDLQRMVRWTEWQHVTLFFTDELTIVTQRSEVIFCSFDELWTWNFWTLNFFWTWRIPTLQWTVSWGNEEQLYPRKMKALLLMQVKEANRSTPRTLRSRCKVGHSGWPGLRSPDPWGSSTVRNLKFASGASKGIPLPQVAQFVMHSPLVQEAEYP